MGKAWKTYRVRFAVRDWYEGTVKARTRHEALARGQAVYMKEGEAAFVQALSEGGLEAWEAEEDE